MKFHYKTPDEVKEKYPGKPSKLANPFSNRTFWMILADAVLLLLIFGIMYKTGNLDSFFPSPADLKIKATLSLTGASQSQEPGASRNVIAVTLVNDSDRDLKPNAKNGSFNLLSAALLSGTAHSSTQKNLAEFTVRQSPLPDEWKIGESAQWMIELDEDTMEKIAESQDLLLLIRFRNLDREVPVVR
ncbi:MAG: hypothetical protein KDK33_13605 [Leptospiraceae bacterium]|nr:hypothetical protein [Leptospiraceae bacterium]